MTDYARSKPVFEHSIYSDYRTKKTDVGDFEYYETTPAHVWRGTVLAETGGQTVTLSIFTAITELIVKNLDATNYVNLAYTGSDDNSNILKISANEDWIKISDVKTGTNLTLTANTANCECEIIVSGTMA